MISAEEFNCLFCQDSFDSKEELQIHFRKHGDPKFNQSVKSKSQTEMAASGDKVDDGEVVSCDVCEEVFPTISKAITHKHKMHPDHDAKYFCPWCGKLFTMKHLYNKHIQSTHNSKEQSEETGFHCDYCEVDFFVPSAMVYHNKFFHRQDTELAAIGHSKKLKMFSQEPLQIYYCPFCGEEYCNKVNLHKHMGDDHIDENQSPEDVLRCPLCEAVFYHLDAYELHLTFHSPDDQYSEDNELIKEITEFSLETVPPIMEKVENESQEDEPIGSMGIEEFLQQGMNESNDNDTSDEPRKKKKHKKHKKSKKTITLDEFLNMHSDVLGEGLDVQGIVEVPSQVVTKQLRKPQLQKLKPGPKPLPSELAKLQKAGIVIKKKPTPIKGIKMAIKKPVINTAQIGGKLITPVQTKPDVKTSSNDILSKLLNQSNSQIKIVKRSGEGHQTKDILTCNEGSSENEQSKETHHNDKKVNKYINYTNEDTNEVNNGDNLKDLEKDDKVNEANGCSREISSQDSDKQCSTTVNSNTKENKYDSKTTLEEKEATDVSLSPNKNLQECAQLPGSDVGKITAHGVNTMTALRNISQYVTVKSVSSPNSVQIEQKPLSVKETDNRENLDMNEEIRYDNKTNNILNDDTNKGPLNVLKHLSHLTVKSANQTKIITSPTTDDITEKNTANNENLSKNLDINVEGEDRPWMDEFENESHNTNSFVVKDVRDTRETTTTKFEALKNLSKHITVKSMAPSPKSSKSVTEIIQQSDSDINEDLADQNVNENSITTHNKQNTSLPNRQVAIKSLTNFKSPQAKLSSPNHSPKIQKMQPGSEVQSPNNELVVYNPKGPTSVNILKQLPNITAKPINVVKNFTQKVMVQSSTQSNNVQKGNMFQSSVMKSETKEKEEIEIFNIEDSDDEDIGPQNSAKIQQNSKPINASKMVETMKAQEKSIEVLKNLSKNITIKPKNQLKPLIHENYQDHDEMLEDEPHMDDEDNFFNEDDKISPQKTLESEVNTLLHNKLKSLGNITMKSNNSSPKNLASSHSSQKFNNQEENYDSDPDTSSKLKITELPDDYSSDDDIPLQKTKKSNLQRDENMPESHNDNESDNETHIDDDDDIEKHIKPITLIKLMPNLNKTPSCLNNLKNLTVKSLKENKIDQVDEEVPKYVNNENPTIQNKQLAIRPFRQDIPTAENQESATKPARQQIRRAMNQNASTSSNQVNTVNKEVTVQTFQTKTVIQEITTTVTKTIRTVNQTNQEVQNMSQKITTPARPQKMQSIRPNQQIKNFQGMSVRPATPLRPRIRNPVTATRPPVGANIRPSNQLVPMRPSFNVARMSNPRMPVLKKSPTSSPHKPVIGKPLKISPNAMMPATKRPAPDEATGPFSCFKKPKESLIPGHAHDYADNEGDSAVQYASSSHMSRSNYTCTTKTVKGNSVVTATQMKSEVSASSEQLNRLNSMSGLKVVKSNQIKQASKVEERVEVNSAKQSALSAIEKLQKQGLLVKKPRIEEPEDSDHSNSDADDDYYDT